MARELPPGFESPHPTFLAYRGPGIAAADHLQNCRFEFDCPECKTIDSVIVISSQWSVQLHSGDARGIFSARCEACDREFSGGFDD